MKNPIIIVLIAVQVGATIAYVDDSTADNSAKREPVEQRFIDESASLSRLVFQLAAERHSANSNRGQVCIFTIHRGTRIEKFTDQKYTLVSLPAQGGTDRMAAERYATAYNSFELDAADLKVKAGKYREAREIYGLLMRFDCSDGAIKKEIEQRLPYLDKLEEGKDVQENLKQFLQLHNGYFPLIDFSAIDRGTPSVVTNLLEVRLP